MARPAPRRTPRARSSGRGVRPWPPQLLKVQTYDRILIDIVLGAFAPGARLDERGLARRYEAGLAGVREALNRLALEGLVLRRPRAGTVVAPLDLEELGQTLHVRALLEPEAAALAAARAAPEDIDALHEALDGAEAAVRSDDRRALADMDRRFNAAVARAGRNGTLARTLEPLQHRAARVWIAGLSGSGEAERLQDVERRRALAAAIAAGEPEAARAATVRLLESAPARLTRLVAST